MQKSLFRKFFNRTLHLLARFLPGNSSTRPFLHRLRGVKIYGKVYIYDDVYLENEYPEVVEIHDNVRIGLRSTIVGHIRGAGKVVIEKDAWIGPCSTIVTASDEVRKIGEGSVISAGSVVNKNVPPYTLVAGVPASPVARVTIPLAATDNILEFKRGLRPLRD